MKRQKCTSIKFLPFCMRAAGQKQLAARLRRTINAVFTVAIALIVSSCGGGTTGSSSTGGEKLYRTYRGTLFSTERNPVRGAMVSLEEGIATAVTDRSGGFEVSGLTGSSAVISVNTSGQEIEVTVNDILSDASAIALDVTLEGSAGQVRKIQTAVSISDNCAGSEQSLIRGRTVSIAAPTTPIECIIRYRLKGTSSHNVVASAITAPGMCPGITDEVSPVHEEGDELIIDQKLTITSISQTCGYLVPINFLDLFSNLTFTVTIFPDEILVPPEN